MVERLCACVGQAGTAGLIERPTRFWKKFWTKFSWAGMGGLGGGSPVGRGSVCVSWASGYCRFERRADKVLDKVLDEVQLAGDGWVGRGLAGRSRVCVRELGKWVLQV